MTLADRVVVMNAGLIEQVGSPNDLYHMPTTKFVAGFIGSPAMNFLVCHLEEPGGALRLGLRPEHIMETRPHTEPNQHDFDMKIDVVEPMGMETLVYFTVEGTEICGRVNPNAGAAEGRTMKLRADLNNMHLIDNGTGKVL